MQISERHGARNEATGGVATRLAVFCQGGSNLDRIAEYCDAAGYAVAAQRFDDPAYEALLLARAHVVVLEDGENPQHERLIERACRELRARRSASYVLVFSERAVDERERKLISLGADYYLAPLEPTRFATYLSSLMVRVSKHPAPPTQVGALLVDGERRICSDGDGPIPLTATEFDILSQLLRKQGCVVWLHEIAQQVLACNDNEASRARVRQHVYALKRKSPAIAELIKTVRRCGYVLESKREPRSGESGILPASRI